ncbi:hypothetical protein PIB30_011371 [Stylosanthes scabra]|uniref:Uncharacterized protein n=1 Tax=Stylosanthes scabra TaxID=79078 RepID=A0ABU6Y673_9FABA|nr:hypothetical protein [Stylosanthes scabra]
MGSRVPTIKGARAHDPSRTFPESNKSCGADARAMWARQEGGAAAPCYLVASAECGQAHRANAPRLLCGSARRAGAPKEGRGGAVAAVARRMAFSYRAAAPPGGCSRANALVFTFSLFFSFFLYF